MPRSFKKLFSTKLRPMGATAGLEPELSCRIIDLLRFPAEIRVKIYEEVVYSAEIYKNIGLVSSSWDGNETSENGDYLDDNVVGTPNEQATPGHNTDNIGHVRSESVKSFVDILTLRLVCRQVTQELDYEIVKHTTSRIERLISTLKRPFGYSACPNNLFHPLWQGQPLLVLEPKPKTYKDIQNLRFTTFASDIDNSGKLGDDQLIFLDALGPHVRSVVLNMVIPKHVTAARASEQHVRSVVNRAIKALNLHMFYEMCDIVIQEQHVEGKPLPRGGVVKVQVCFPAGHTYDRSGSLCDVFVIYGETVGLEVDHFERVRGQSLGTVFAFAGVDTLAKSRGSRRGILGHVKSAWNNVTAGRLG